MEVVEHIPTLTAFQKKGQFKAGDMFWTSNPSSRDGEYWPHFDEWLILMRKHYPRVGIYLDVSYVGTVKRHQPLRPAQHGNIKAVVFSLSKPFGVYKHRIGGFYSRRPSGIFAANKWFNNLFSVRLGHELMQRHAVDDLPKRYAWAQERAIKQLQAEGHLPQDAEAANVVLLARSTTGPAEFKRADGYYRYCIKPTIEQIVNQGDTR